MKRTNLKTRGLLACGLFAMLGSTAYSQSGFITNAGQVHDETGLVHPEILYTLNISGASIYISKDKISYVFSQGNQSHRADLSFFGANGHITPVAGELNTEKYNYYTGQEAASATSSQQVTLSNLYDNIDLLLTSDGSNLSYKFNLKAGAKASDIRFSFDGVTNTTINATGLIAETPLGSIHLPAPNVSKTILGLLSLPALGSYTQTSGLFGFSQGGGLLGLSGGGLISLNSLITIPIFSAPTQWTTYLGGSKNDVGTDLVNDSYGNIYHVGETFSPDFPRVTGANQSTLFGDAYVSMFNNTGKLIFMTLIKGSKEDFAKAVSVMIDPASQNPRIFITGGTTSTDFVVKATSDGYQYQATKKTPANAYSAFITELDKTGAVQWSTYFGDGSGNSTFGTALTAYDFSRDGGTTTTGPAPTGPKQGQKQVAIVFGGVVQSKNGGLNFPYVNSGVAGGFDETYKGGKSDGYVGLFGLGQINALAWCSAYGSSGDQDAITSIAIDNSKNVFIQGYVNGPDFQIVTSNGAYAQKRLESVGLGTLRSDIDATITKLNSQFVHQWSTYLGGTYDESSFNTSFNGMGLQVTDAFIVQGGTSINFPVAWQGAHTISFDGQSNVYVGGETQSNNFPNATGVSSGADAGIRTTGFFAKFSNAGIMSFIKYFGNRSTAAHMDLTAIKGLSYNLHDDVLVLTGETENSGNFPVMNATNYYNQAGMRGSISGFFAGFKPNGTQMWGTYFGGNDETICYAVATGNPKIAFAGTTTSNLSFPISPRVGSYNQLLPGGSGIFNAIGSDAFVGTFDVVGANVSLPFLSKTAPSTMRLGSVQDQLSLMPNPTSSHITVSLPDDAKGAVLELYNIKGEKVHQEQIDDDNSSKAIDMNDLPAGIYMLRYTNNQTIINQKVVKQ